MLFRYLFSDPLIFLFLAGALVFCLSIHEMAHAYVADKLGDPTGRMLGRITINPLAHLDPVGTILLLFFGFGWGKPVPFNPYNLKNPKRDSALIALAGPAINFIFSIIFALLFHLITYLSFANTFSPYIISLFEYFQLFLYLSFTYNLFLCFFNLIPVHPLDGFKVVNGLLPEDLSFQWLQMAPYGIYILMLLIFTRTTSTILGPIITFFTALFGF